MATTPSDTLSSVSVVGTGHSLHRPSVCGRSHEPGGKGAPVSLAGFVELRVVHVERGATLRFVHQTVEQPIAHSLVAVGIWSHVARAIQRDEQGAEGVHNGLADDFIAKSALVDDDLEQLHVPTERIVGRRLAVPRTPIQPHPENGLRMQEHSLTTTQRCAPEGSGGSGRSGFGPFFMRHATFVGGDKC
jgi:hypothetical protein